jgi:hypothetical protein
MDDDGTARRCASNWMRHQSDIKTVSVAASPSTVRDIKFKITCISRARDEAIFNLLKKPQKQKDLANLRSGLKNPMNRRYHVPHHTHIKLLHHTLLKTCLVD